MPKLGFLLFLAILLVLLSGYKALTREYPQVYEETPGPWRVVPTGRPLTELAGYVKPDVGIVEQGRGAPVEVGDFVEIEVDWGQWKNPDVEFQKQKFPKRVSWWIWLGFIRDKRSPYGDHNLPSDDGKTALLGMTEGTVFQFKASNRKLIRVDETDNIQFFEEKFPQNNPQVAQLWVKPMPYGSWRHYQFQQRSNVVALEMAWRAGQAPGNAAAQSIAGDVPLGTAERQIKILRRCPAELHERTVRVESSSPVHISGFFFHEVSTRPRKLWALEAELVGRCDDGKTVRFKQFYGGGSPPKGEDYGMVLQGYWDSWVKERIRKTPYGVRATGDGLDEAWVVMTRKYDDYKRGPKSAFERLKDRWQDNR